jgi:hypothetical protein
MNWGRYLTPRIWRDRMVEFLWRREGDHAIPRERLTWVIGSEDLRRIRFRWPRGSNIQSEGRRAMGNQIAAALKRFVPVEEAHLQQQYDKCINAEVIVDGHVHQMIVETSDYAPLNERAYDESAIHFKMEFSKDGYGDRPHLFPGGYVTADAVIYKYLARLRRIRDELPPLYQVYGRYGLSMEKRRKPLEMLRSTDAFEFYGGEGKVRYRGYLEEAARSAICIDLPSMSSVTWRMIDLLAIGSCIVGPPHTNQMQVPFVDGTHVAYCKSDYSDIISVCRRYLDDEVKRRDLVRQSREFFDTYLHRDQLASYYIHCCLKLFG